VSSNFAGHSLRSGFLTEAARSRATVFQMGDVSRHRSMTTLLEYVREATQFDKPEKVTFY